MSSTPAKRGRADSASPQSSSRQKPVYDSDMNNLDASDDDDDQLFEYEDFDDDDQEEHHDARGGERDDAMDADDEEGQQQATQTIIIDDSDDEQLPPPEPTGPPKGKLSSRKLYLADVEALCARHGSPSGELVKNFEPQGDESVQFTLVHPAYKRGLRLVLMVPEHAGYPSSHQMLCYAESEIGPDVEEVLAEVASLPPQADRSLEGVIQYLITRIILAQPSPYPTVSQQSQHTQEETDEEEYEYDDDLFGIGSSSTGHLPAFTAALRSDFKDLIAAGFRPGYTRVSELDNVVSVSKKVNTLGVPLRALQAWDSDLITGEVRYLVLLMNFGSRYPVDPDNGTRGDVKFRVGLSPKYKPSKEAIAAAFRSHSANTYTKNDFDAISLSKPLDSLFTDKFQEILLTRRSNKNLGWAGAELHCLTPGKAGQSIDKKACRAADKDEESIAGSYVLPNDPMGKKASTTLANNYPLVAFSYLIRRFVMCPRHCLICLKKINTEIVALKPFVCDSQLCLFQLISLGLGPSLEHEIKTNAPAVDLLIQLAYASAKENAMKPEMQPQGLSLEVPKVPSVAWKKGDPTVEFDSLDVAARNAGVAGMIMELPPVPEMKAWLDGDDLTDNDKQLRRNRKLADMRGGAISNSAWKLLRWIVASNTSYLKQIEDEDELIQGIPKSYRQFRLVVGSPAKEHLLAENVKAVQVSNANARTFPTLYAWHGSAVKNWHSILREGLHFKETVGRRINGRAYGHGVYFAKQGEVSLSHYAAYANSTWKNAEFGVGKLAAICEIVNSPSQFVSQNPYFVVDKVDWIQCRYLIIQRGASYNYQPAETTSADENVGANPNQLTTPIPLDRAHPITLNSASLIFPDLLPKLKAMNEKLAAANDELNLSDTELLKEPSIVITDAPKSKTRRGVGPSSSRVEAAAAPVAKEKDTFVPCGENILSFVRVLPPPARPNAGAVRNITLEVNNIIAEQEKVGPTKAGFYLDLERSNDSIFTWILEIPRGSLDPTLPLVKDMVAKNVTSLLFEIRFPESFPFSPPFFRLVYPRFLPFIQGMDLLTASGWNPAYNIASILLQIRMAISNLEPKPARLASNWDQPYSMSEAIAGFKRAAETHGWQVPDEFVALTRQA
ncbi:ubiquitin-conjugating enzyme E2 Q [Pseudohyphozyma bogoriensis]|nr:ubiquitin-conjugating enzyme E2 Q [Pseudohyphozyma bogoriensis]